MLLSIIAVVHRSLATLPKERSKLYAQCSKILLEQWDISRGIRVDDTNLKLEQKESVMRRLAYALHTGEIGDPGGGREASRADIQRLIADMLPKLGRPADDAEHLLQMLIERSGIITERHRGSLAFAHHTFQEYFTAQYLATAELISNRDFLLGSEHLMSDWWREVVLLYSGLLSDSSDFIQRIQQSDEEDLFDQRLRLAALCLGEAVEVRKTAVRKQLGAAVARVRNQEALLDSNSTLEPDEVEYLVRWSRHQKWYSHAAVAHAKASTDQKMLATLISAALSDQQVFVRAAASFALAQLPHDLVTKDIANKFVGLLRDDVSEVRSAAIQNVTKISPSMQGEELTIALLDLVGRERGPENALLRKVFDDLGGNLVVTKGVLSKLVSLLKSSEFQKRRLAAKVTSALVGSCSPQILSEFYKELASVDAATLLKTTSSMPNLPPSLSDDHVADKIAVSLAESNDESDTRFRLLEAIKDSRSTVSVHELVIDSIVALVLVKDRRLKDLAIETLSELLKHNASDLVLKKLKELLASSNKTQRLAGLKIVGESFGFPFTEELIRDVDRFAGSGSTEERRLAATAIAVVAPAAADPTRCVQRLSDLAQESNRGVRAAAIDAFGLLRHIELTGPILDLITNGLADRNLDVRLSSARTIGKLSTAFSSKEVIDALLIAFHKSLRLRRRSSEIKMSDRIYRFSTRFRFSHMWVPFEIMRAVASVGACLKSERAFQEMLGVTRSNSWLLDDYHGQFIVPWSNNPLRYWSGKFVDRFEVLDLARGDALLLDELVFVDQVPMFLELKSRQPIPEHPLVTLGKSLPKEIVSHGLLRYFKEGSVSYSPALLSILGGLKSQIQVEAFQVYVKAALESDISATRYAALRLTEDFYSENRLRPMLVPLSNRLSDESTEIQDAAWELISKFRRSGQK